MSLVVSHPASYRPRNSLEGISIIVEYTSYIIEIELTFSELRVILVNLRILLRRCSHIKYRCSYISIIRHVFPTHINRTICIL